MGSPQTPTPEQYTRLKEARQLQLLSSPEWFDVGNGRVTIRTDLPRPAASLMIIKW
jgi:xylan 1,4-beta-xylosidase